MTRFRAGAVMGLAFLAALPTGTAEADSAQATAFVEEVGQEFFTFAKTAPEDIDARTDLLVSFLERRAALPLIARFTAGQNWRRMSDAQKTAYQIALRNLAARFFAARLAEIEGGSFETIRTNEIPDRKGRPERTQYLVTTKVTLAELDPVMIEWRVGHYRDELRIVDFTAEGVSLLVSYRGEMAALFEAASGDANAVIETLTTRAGN